MPKSSEEAPVPEEELVEVYRQTGPGRLWGDVREQTPEGPNASTARVVCVPRASIRPTREVLALPVGRIGSVSRQTAARATYFGPSGVGAYPPTTASSLSLQYRTDCWTSPSSASGSGLPYMAGYGSPPGPRGSKVT